jgi:hypothetical protein
MLFESTKKLIKRSQILSTMNTKKDHFYSINIHAKVFLYIYDNKILIVKHAIIPINCW